MIIKLTVFLLILCLTACGKGKDLNIPMEQGDVDPIPKEAVLQSEKGEQKDSGKANNEEETKLGEIGQFNYEEISEEIKARILGKSYPRDCEVPFEDLRYVNVLYWGFDGESHQGELIVNKAIAEDIVEIFKELYELKYPIERMVLIDEYDAVDNDSMAANNTSSFNYRKIDGSDNLSLHSYGLAIDINPLYNPYVRQSGEEKIILPENGAEYADRALDCDYYIEEGDACYNAFIQRGFTWGGEWKTKKDYQHFQKKIETTLAPS